MARPVERLGRGLFSDILWIQEPLLICKVGDFSLLRCLSPFLKMGLIFCIFHSRVLNADREYIGTLGGEGRGRGYINGIVFVWLSQ